jgi:choice-of-anchor B domain-containing protein
MVFHGQVTPSQMGAEPITLFGLAKGFASDIEQWTSGAGEQYALVTHTGGVGFVRVTDPDDTQFVGTVPSGRGASLTNVGYLWGDPDSWDHYGYFVREGFGEILGDPAFDTEMLIVDLAGLDALGPAGDAIDISGAVQTWSRTPGGYEGAHNIEIDDEGFAYLPGTHVHPGAACGDDPGPSSVLILDVAADPTDPPVAGCVPNTGEHDIFIVNDYDGPDPDHQGRDIAFVFDGGTAETFVWDVTDRSAPTEISRFSLASEGMIFSHNGAPTDDLGHLFIGDEIDELVMAEGGELKPGMGTYIMDISDLDAPVFDERYSDGTVGIDHNFVVHDGRLYIASYNSGTRVFDIVDESDGSVTLSPIARMDTEPRLPNKILNLNQEFRFTSNFLGQWGIDVFDDGTIIASDLNNGVIVSSLSDTPCTFMKCQR